MKIVTHALTAPPPQKCSMPNLVSLNGMSLGGSTDALWTALHSSFCNSNSARKPPAGKALRAAVQRSLSRAPSGTTPMCVLILDEMDAFLPRGTLAKTESKQASARPLSTQSQAPTAPVSNSPNADSAKISTPTSMSTSSSQTSSGSSRSGRSDQSGRTTPASKAASKRSALKHAAGVNTCRGVASGVDALYSLFDIACSDKSRLVFVGMANAINMISQALPRLASMGIQHEKVLFAPYSQVQVQRIITARLADAEIALLGGDATSSQAKRAALGGTGFPPPSVPQQRILAPPALGLLSKKVAARSGDMRLMLQLVRAAAGAAAKRLGAADAAALAVFDDGADCGPSQASSSSSSSNSSCSEAGVADPSPLSQGSCDSVHAGAGRAGGGGDSPHRSRGTKRCRADGNAQGVTVDPPAVGELLAKGPLVSMKDALDAVKAVLTSPYVPALKALPTNCQVVVALAVGCARARARASTPSAPTNVDLWANKGWDLKLTPTGSAAAAASTVRVAGATVSVGELSTAFNRVARKKLLDVHAVAAADFGDLVSRAVESGMLAVVTKGPGRGSAAGGSSAEWGLGLGVGVQLRVNIGEEEVTQALGCTPLATVLQSELLGMGVLKGLLKAR